MDFLFIILVILFMVGIVWKLSNKKTNNIPVVRTKPSYAKIPSGLRGSPRIADNDPIEELEEELEEKENTEN